jgi:hypothetical protein
MEHPQPWWRGRLVIAAAALALGACVHQTPPHTGRLVPADCDIALCTIDAVAWNHIDQGHCQGTCLINDKSIFDGAYCVNQANAVTFCQTLMGRPDCAGADQPNGRVAYTATFAAVVGTDLKSACNNTTQGTVIYDPAHVRVVTQFPGNP